LLPARPARPQSDSRSDTLALALQAALVVAVFGCALAWFSASPDSPYAALPEVVFARKLATGVFWKVRCARRSTHTHPTATPPRRGTQPPQKRFFAARAPRTPTPPTHTPSFPAGG
jgi:hypothetical protein